MNTAAYAAMTAASPLAPHRIERRATGANDVRIDIAFCGVCHSDIHQARGEWGDALFPMVPGHEIVGIVSEVGAEVKTFKAGDRVGVGCFVDSCRTCEACEAGEEQYCHAGSSGTYNSTERDKQTPTYGGYAKQIVVDAGYVLRIPDNLPLDGAAPLLCAGITTYSPLRHWRAGPGKKVAIVGLGGLGHMGVKLAAAMGCDVTVLSQTLSKEADGRRLGAHHFHATQNPETFTQLAGTFDLILNTVSVPLDWNAYLGLLKRDGTLVLLGAPPEPSAVSAFAVIGGRKSLAGSLIGGIQETQAMLDFCGEHGITSDIEIIPMDGINNAYERMVRSDVKYRFVIDMATLAK